jgi:hypothetical protein
MVYENKLEFGLRTFLDSSHTKFNFLTKDTFNMGDTIVPRLTFKNLLNSDTGWQLVILRLNGDTVLRYTRYTMYNNTSNIIYAPDFGQKWKTDGFRAVLFELHNWLLNPIDTTFFYVK